VDERVARAADAVEAMRAWLVGEVQALVQAPAAVVVDLVTVEGPVTFMVVRTAPADVGRIIGKGGGIIGALRTLAEARAGRCGVRVHVEVAGTRSRRLGDAS
jgi:predicted RNA-binding protein YlqC (UPF0109 family)